MATIPVNETRMSINAPWATARYGERITELARQHRREGNNAGANAAGMMARQIHGIIQGMADVLPMIAPPHAALIEIEGIPPLRATRRCRLCIVISVKTPVRDFTLLHAATGRCPSPHPVH